jgi:hypothetical protein
MSYLNQDKFQEKPKSIVFNNGKAGVVTNCKLQVVKKTAEDNEKSPAYKILAFDQDQQTNKDESIVNYPVNKAYFYTDIFNTEKGESFAVNELKHLLKTFDHLTDETGLKIEEPINSYNNLLDYTMKYVNTHIKSVNPFVDVVVDYGNAGFAKQYLQLNGYPWWIGKTGAKLSNSRVAILERPVADTPETKEDISKEW